MKHKVESCQHWHHLLICHFSTGSSPWLVPSTLHSTGHMVCTISKGTIRWLGLEYSQLRFLLVFKSVNTLILLNLSDKSVAMPRALSRYVCWALLITQTLTWSCLQRVLLFESASAQSPGDLRGFRDINMNGVEGVRCVPTVAPSPSVSDYGKGGINTKTADLRALKFAIWWSLLVPDQLLGLSHGLVKQLPKWAENHNIDILGHVPEQSLSPADWVKDFSCYFNTSVLSAIPRAHSWNQHQTNTVETLFHAVLGRELIFAL